MHVVERDEVAASRLYRIAEVDGDDLASSVRGGEVRVPPGSAAGIENAFPFEARRRYRVEPVEELRLELWVHLGEVLPLPTERVGGLALLLLEVGRDEARDPAPNTPAPPTATAGELASLHFVGGRIELERVRGHGA